jgi:prepilin-type N-terminal cleavage/methylation domain-containing protein
VKLKNQKSSKGVSLIELMVALLIFTTVMMTFAMAFPGGYRLNVKSRNENKAAQLANGVINKLQNMEFARRDSFGLYSDVPTLENMVSFDPYTNHKFNSYFCIDNSARFVDPQGNVTIFYLPDPSKDPAVGLKGIDVALDDINYPTWSTITVTVAWKETLKQGVLTKSITVRALRSSNHR